MAIVNRDLSFSEKVHSLQFSMGDAALSPGATGILAYVPYPCVLIGAQVASMSLDGSPDMILTVSRFTSAGSSTWTVGSTFALRAFGTSGVLDVGVSMPVAGSTFLNLRANDLIGFQMNAGSTYAAFGVAGAFYVKPTQDIVSYINGAF